MAKATGFKKKGYILAGCALLVVLALAGGLYLWAAFMADSYASRRLATLAGQYGLRLQYAAVSCNLSGEVRLRGLRLFLPAYNLTLQADKCTLKGHFSRTSFEAQDLREADIEGLRLLFSKARRIIPEQSRYASRLREAEKTLAALAAKLPPTLSVRGLQIGDYHIPRLLVEGRRFVAEMPGKEGLPPWICRGVYDAEKAKLQLQLFTREDKAFAFPFLPTKWKADLRLRSLTLDLQAEDSPDRRLALEGKLSVTGLSLNQPALDSGPVDFGEGTADFRLLVDENSVETDPVATQIHYRQLDFHPYIWLQKEGSWKLRASIDKDFFPAEDFFASLPQSLFPHLYGMKVSGKIDYHFLFDIDFAHPDGLVFHSDARTDAFKILSYGETDLRMMRDPFPFIVRWKDGRERRRFEVGPSNPSFYPLRKLPGYLIQALLHAEDYSFFHHHGFTDQAFHRSLVDDIRARRFVRGASTISMQVVKNVYLNQEKNFSRKLEEILMVWLIERNHLVSKNRLLETYLNIIEWGPDIYGIAEASRYYFIKEPSALTLSECIFLTYIIPDPKHIRENFNGLRQGGGYQAYFRNAVRRLRQRGLISATQAAQANPEVRFRGAVLRQGPLNLQP
ncbi:MAG: transglycosylase domain-containing protein [Tannerella sp.]|jgi:hypothetical protein|nr:transglycosylase domain-containing protein [Tannerella sp.]